MDTVDSILFLHSNLAKVLDFVYYWTNSDFINKMHKLFVIIVNQQQPSADKTTLLAVSIS